MENLLDPLEDSGRVWIGTPNVDVGFLCPTVRAKTELSESLGYYFVWIRFK
jgi:hypothetical protein